MPRADPEPPRRVNNSNRAHHVIKVRERFAHTHENYVVDPFPAGTLNGNNLIDNFVRAQIARKSFQTASAEFTTKGATYLRRNTKRPAIRFLPVEGGRRGNQNRLDQVFIAQTEQKLPSRVARSKNADNVHCADRKSLSQASA